VRIPTLLPIFGLLLMTLGCQQKLDSEELIYTGNWQSEKSALQIYQNGYGVCNSRQSGFVLHFQGRVKINGNRMVFVDEDNSLVLRKRFRIDQPPTADPNGLTYMILDGQRFERF